MAAYERVPAYVDAKHKGVKDYLVKQGFTVTDTNICRCRVTGPFSEGDNEGGINVVMMLQDRDGNIATINAEHIKLIVEEEFYG